LKSGSLNLLEPSGPLQACNGIALPLPYTIFGLYRASKNVMGTSYFGKFIAFAGVKSEKDRELRAALSFSLLQFHVCFNN
jgi:hypothetical protein